MTNKPESAPERWMLLGELSPPHRLSFTITLPDE